MRNLILCLEFEKSLRIKLAGWLHVLICTNWCFSFFFKIRDFIFLHFPGKQTGDRANVCNFSKTIISRRKKEEMRVDYFEPSLYKILRKLNLISKGTKSTSLKRFDKFNIFD